MAFEELSSSQDCEAAIIKVPLHGKKTLIIGSVYRPPSSNNEYNYGESLCLHLHQNPKIHKCNDMVDMWRPKLSSH